MTLYSVDIVSYLWAWYERRIKKKERLNLQPLALFITYLLKLGLLFQSISRSRTISRRPLHQLNVSSQHCISLLRSSVSEDAILTILQREIGQIYGTGHACERSPLALY